VSEAVRDTVGESTTRRLTGGGGGTQWVSEVKAENAQASESANGFCVFLVGCKADHYKVVDRHEAEAVAKKLGAEYFEVSAKTGTPVLAVMLRARHIYTPDGEVMSECGRGTTEEAAWLCEREWNEPSSNAAAKPNQCLDYTLRFIKAQ
jgi:hypothetical protein